MGRPRGPSPKGTVYELMKLFLDNIFIDIPATNSQLEHLSD